MLYRLKHGSISFYTAGFITPDLRLASVYVEFCDRGSLENLILAYDEHRMNEPPYKKPEIPERFIWHAFAGLCDGLAYLLGGRSYMPKEVTDYSRAPGWIPVLHRDMKPDNVLLRSRDTLGSKKYFYCVLSDFGLACEDRPPGHPEEDRWQMLGNKLGTKTFYAPEHLYNPYPKKDPYKNPPDLQFRLFPNGQKHTVKSDLYSLGASIYNMADLGPVIRNGRPMNMALSHINFDARPFNVNESDFWEGTLSRKHPLDISKVKLNRPYTKQLRDAILEATTWDPRERPDAIQMVRRMKVLMGKSGFLGHVPENSDEELPSWATRVHDYHSREPLDPRQFDPR
jgi:serine/threonine protein kinase